MANCRLHLSGCNHGGMTGGLATMENCKLHLSECSNCVHPLMLKHTVWSCIKKPQLRLRLETSCSLKKDASFEEQGTPIGKRHPPMLKRSQHTVWSCIKKPQLRLRLETSCSLKKDASFEEQGTPIGDMNGTLVAPESRVATSRDMNGTLVAAESRVATARIDWLGMSNEEFKKRIKEMAQSPLPRSHLMSEGEFGDFCIRREEMLYQAGKMVSKFYQDVDLPAQLLQLRGEQLSASDTVSLEHGIVARKKDVAKVKRTKKSSLDDFRM